MAEVLQDLMQQMAQEFPGFRVCFKDQSWHQRALGAGLKGVGINRYMTNFVTVFGNTVWWPDEAMFRRDGKRAASVLLHERVHLWDRRRMGVLFDVSYVAAGPAVWTMRAHWERRAYAVDIVRLSRFGRSPEWIKAWLTPLFSKHEYGFMWPFPDEIHAWVDRTLDEGLAGEVKYDGDEELYATTEVWLERLLAMD